MDKELKIRVVFDTGKAKIETTEFAEGSIGALEKSLKDAKLAMKDLTVGTEAHQAALVKLKQLQAEVSDAYGRGIVATKNIGNASANAAVTLQALNYTVRDSPYFFRDFSLGILAIGNNINPLIDGLKRMNDEAKASNQTFWQLANKAMGSGGWFTLGMSFAVTAIQAVTFALSKNKDSVEELDKSLKVLGETFDSIIRLESPFDKFFFPIKPAQISIMLDNVKKQVRDTLDEMDKIINTFVGARPGRIWTTDPQEIIDEMKRRGLDKDAKQLENLIKEKIAREDLIKTLEAQKIKAEALELAYKTASEAGLTATSKEKVTKEKTTKDIDGQDPLNVIERLEKLQQFKLKLENELEEARIKHLQDDEEKELESFKLMIKKKKEELTKAWEDLPLADIDARNKYMLAMSGLGEEEIKGISDIKRKFADKRKDKEREQVILKWKNDLKVNNELLNDAKGFANDVGMGLIQAFTGGKNALDSFLVSLEAAIAKMLVMMAIEAILGAIFPMPTLSAPPLPGLSKGLTLKPMDWSPFKNIVSPNLQNANLQKSMQIMNMNMVSGQPTILIEANVPGIEFTKKVINPSQYKLRRNNISVL